MAILLCITSRSKTEQCVFSFQDSYKKCFAKRERGEKSLKKCKPCHFFREEKQCPTFYKTNDWSTFEVRTSKYRSNYCTSRIDFVIMLAVIHPVGTARRPLSRLGPINPALAEAANKTAPEYNDITSFDPSAEDTEEKAKAVAAEFHAVSFFCRTSRVATWGRRGGKGGNAERTRQWITCCCGVSEISFEQGRIDVRAPKYFTSTAAAAHPFRRWKSCYRYGVVGSCEGLGLRSSRKQMLPGRY